MTAVKLQVEGTVAPGFEKVADAFAENFRERGDTGAACTVYAGGQPVVDIWAGSTGDGPWTRDTRSMLMSVSKGVTTVCVLMAVEEGLIELDAPVADYWPEFAAEGKQAVTVRQLLTHQAGLMAPDADLTVADLAGWEPVTEALARQAPLWPPGTAFDYHAQTFGWLAGEVLRRASGKRPGEWLRDRIAQPLGLNLSFGAEPGSPGFALIGEPLPSTDPVAVEEVAAFLSTPLVQRSFRMGGAIDSTDLFREANTPAYLSYESPAVNLVGNAHDLARLYAATVGEIDGVRLLGPEVVRDAREPRSEGPQFATGIDNGSRWATGFQVDSRRLGMVGPGSFGHDGAGGHLAFAHLELEIGFGYQTIRPGGFPDDRAEALCRALRASL